MGGGGIYQTKLFDPKRVKKNSKKNKRARSLCQKINKLTKGLSNPKQIDLTADAGLIQLKLSGGIKPEYAPYEVSDKDLAILEGILFQLV